MKNQYSFFCDFLKERLERDISSIEGWAASSRQHHSEALLTWVTLVLLQCSHPRCKHTNTRRREKGGLIDNLCHIWHAFTHSLMSHRVQAHAGPVQLSSSFKGLRPKIGSERSSALITLVHKKVHDQIVQGLSVNQIGLKIGLMDRYNVLCSMQGDLLF